MSTNSIYKIQLVALFICSALHGALVPSSETPKLFSIDAFIRSGFIPSDKKAAEQRFALTGLNKLLELQQKILPLSRAFISFDRNYFEKLNRNEALRNENPLYVQGCFAVDDPEAIAFALRYPLLLEAMKLSDMSFNHASYQQVKMVVEQWKHTQNPYILEIINISEDCWDNLYINQYNIDHVKGPMDALLRESEIAQKQYRLSSLYALATGPLSFLHAIANVIKKYDGLFKKHSDYICQDKKLSDEKKLADHLVLNVLSELSALSTCTQSEQEKISVAYQDAQPALKQLQQQISSVLAATKDDPYSHIRDMPCMRMQQKQKRPQPTKKKKVMQVRPAVHIAPRMQPCSSTDPVPVTSASTEVPDQIADHQLFASPQELLDSYKLPARPMPVYERIEHPDGSYIKHEDDIRVILHDAPLNTEIQLFKVDNPQSECRDPQYTPWVQKWFDAPEEALAGQGYNDPASERFKYRATARQVHAFTRLVDRFLPQCGTGRTITNKRTGRQNIVVTIPGMVAGQMSLLGYNFEKQRSGSWLCFHRNAIARKGRQLVDEYRQKGFYDVEFPELR